MRPQDLRFTHVVENRGFLEQQILYVPRRGDREGLLDLSIGKGFSQELPLAIEYCSGNGDWVVEQARQNPHRNWIAVERKLDRVRKIWSKRENAGLHNLLIVWGEALLFTQHYLADGVLEAIYINFPDPWPKNRHAKNRLIGEPFFRELERVLRDQGRLVLVTDEILCGEMAVKTISPMSQWQYVFPAPYYQLERPGYGSSYFETLWKREGKKIFYYEFLKKCL